MRILTLDFETFWDSKGYTLSKMSPIDYIRDERFHAQVLGMCYDQEPVQIYATDTTIAEALASVQWNNAIVVAHNLDGFDALILSERYGISPKWTLDTIVLMRWLGISSVAAENHATLTRLLGTGVKMQGTVISDGKHWPQDFTQAEQEAFKLYCSQDVDQCRKNFFAMIHTMTSEEFAEVVRFASLTNRMGTASRFWPNLQMLEAYRDELRAKTEKARQELSTIFHFHTEDEFLKAIRSTAMLTQMFESLGATPPMVLSEARTQTTYEHLKAEMKANPSEELQRQLDEKAYEVYVPSYAKTNQEFLDMQEHPDERVALLARTRLENYSSSEMARCENLIRYARQGKPLPILLKTFAAHTSRYGAGTSEGKSAGLNPQNFARGSKLRTAIETPEGYSLVACDSAQIECRVLAYEAQQQDLLELFRKGGDPYANLGAICYPQYTAQQIHDGAKAGDKELKLIRQISKTIILGCGYGTGARKASAMLWRSHTRMAETKEEHDKKVSVIHGMYRKTNSCIVAFWKVCDQVLQAMLLRNTGTFGGPDNQLFTYGIMPVIGYGDVPSILLPSGFCLRYPNLRQELGEDGKYEMVYDRKRGKNTIPTRIFGAALTENLTQALAFQILMWQANKLSAAGLAPNVNVHDDFAFLCADKCIENVKQCMVEIMSTSPPWAPGLPLSAEAEVGKNFEVI